MAGVSELGASPFLSTFRLLDVEAAPGLSIRAAVGGAGPPLLLMHGHPQTHITWRKVAPGLAKRFTVVAADLRGYGDSAKPEGGPDHYAYSKREMAKDQIAVMSALGYGRFSVVGHDRGGRVAHRMALDHPRVLEKLAVLDIAPTATMYARTDKTFATRYFWWFFLIQPEPLPERLLAGDPEFFLRTHIDEQNKTPGATEPAAFADYLRCYENPAMRHAACEDYRAAATVDLDHDAEDDGRKIQAPLLALWGAKSAVGQMYDVLETWREKAEHVEGRGLPCGHTLQEELPEETAAELLAFL